MSWGGESLGMYPAALSPMLSPVLSSSGRQEYRYKVCAGFPWPCQAEVCTQELALWTTFAENLCNEVICSWDSNVCLCWREVKQALSVCVCCLVAAVAWLICTCAAWLVWAEGAPNLYWCHCLPKWYWAWNRVDVCVWMFGTEKKGKLGGCFPQTCRKWGSESCGLMYSVRFQCWRILG